MIPCPSLSHPSILIGTGCIDPFACAGPVQLSCTHWIVAICHCFGAGAKQPQSQKTFRIPGTDYRDTVGPGPGCAGCSSQFKFCVPHAIRKAVTPLLRALYLLIGSRSAATSYTKFCNRHHLCVHLYSCCVPRTTLNMATARGRGERVTDPGKFESSAHWQFKNQPSEFTTAAYDKLKAKSQKLKDPYEKYLFETFLPAKMRSYRSGPVTQGSKSGKAKPTAPAFGGGQPVAIFACILYILSS